MTFGMFVTWMATGLVTGWLVRFLIKDGGYGLVPDLTLSLAGSGVLSTAAVTLGAMQDVGRLGMAAVAIVGAALAVVSQRKIWPAYSSGS